MNRQEHLEMLKRDYKHVELICDGEEYVAYYRLMFHWTMIRGHMDCPWGYDDRWCFDERFVDDKLLVEHAFLEWKERGFEGEPDHWHRHPKSGRRRIDGKPETEYIAH
jgi:hypothetical protein